MIKLLDEKRAFLGVGWAFPTCLDRDGELLTVAYETDVREALRIILGTDHNERVMRPDFGADLKAFVFEPVNSTTMQLLKKNVEEALIKWEPRIEVHAVKVSGDPVEHNKLLIDVEYRVRATNTLANLVYPFYLQEGAQ